MSAPPVIPSKRPAGFGRREFLSGAAGLFFVAACQCGETPQTTPDSGTTITPDAGTDAGTQQNAFRVWEQMRAAARQSPDHLSAKADALVAAKDPTQLFAFVRDQIATVPAERSAIGDQLKLRFGARGALRSGMGSMRDKAELLVELYTRAGFEASVHQVNVQNGAEFVQRALRVVSVPFAPAMTAEQLAEWMRVLQTPTSTEPTPFIDPTGEQAQALAVSLVPLLPTTLEADAFSSFAPLYQPVVRVVIDGTERFANVNLPDLAFGETGGTTTPQPAPSAVPPPPVRIELKAAITTDSSAPATLVSAEIPALELIGRSVFVGFTPVEEFTQLATKKLGEITTFIPSLSLRAPGMTVEQTQANTWVGAPITLSGEVMTVSGDQLLLRGLPIDTSPYDPSRLAQVSSVVATVDAARFPEVRLRAQVLDASGNGVVGLPASAFELTEEGARMGFTLLENAPPPPRVLFVLDRSTSMPAEFRDTGAAQLLQNVATDLLANDPRCQFRVHIIDGNVNDGAWTSDPAVLANAAQTQTGSGSGLWKALAAVSNLGASTIVMVTDGAAATGPTADQLAAISMAPPSLFLQVVTGSTTHLDQMAALTGGLVLSTTDHAQASTQIDTFLVAREKNAYLLRYHAPLEGPATRQVQLRLHNIFPFADATYTPPLPANRVPRGRVGGLLVTIEANGEAPVTRLIAGDRAPAPDAPDALFDEVNGAFFGSTEVHFEGGPPTTGALLEDWLTARLEHEPVLTALAAPGVTVEQMQQAFTSRPPAYHLAAWLPHQAQQQQSGDELIYRTGLRAAITSRVPRFNAPLLRRLDILPIGHHRTIAATKRRSLESNLSSTARLAVMEQAYYETSTLSLLSGQALTHIRPGYTMGSVLPSLPPETIARWNRAMESYQTYHRLVPTSGSPVAFWAVHPTSGELMGVLESGAGGGEGTSNECDLSAMLDGLERLGSLASATGALGSAAGTWYSLEITKARKLLAATVVIAGGTPGSNDPTNWSDFFGSAACDAAKAGAGAGLDRLAQGRGGIAVAAGILRLGLDHDDYVAAATGDSAVCNAPDTSPGGCG